MFVFVWEKTHVLQDVAIEEAAVPRGDKLKAGWPCPGSDVC